MTQELASFAALDLSDVLLKALEDMKFQAPSPVQAQTIPYLLEGRDVIAQAQTGTGKTAAFALPILKRLSLKSRATQALILAPTRELAIQVAEQFEALSVHQKGTTVSVLCGGQEYSRQLKQLRDGAHIVVGTPGRILDHIDRGTLQLHQLKTFVLDEADEMLRMGFIEDVETILAKLPDEKQIALFSATMPYRIRQIANSYLNDPVSVEIKAATATVKAIEQRFLFASPAQKPDALLRVLAVEDYQGVIVFVRTKSSTEEVAALLQQQGYRAMAIHGDITQALRERIIAQFRQGAIDILVATDVAARGLDVDRVTHVINYDVPHDCETYVHRIGRTGRAGRSGVTVLFITPRESRILNTIERHTRQRIEKVVVPNDYMIQQARQERFMANIKSRFGHEHAPGYYRIIEEFLKANPEASAMDVAASLALMLNQDKAWQQELPKPSRPVKETRQRDGEFKSEFKSARAYEQRQGSERKGFGKKNIRDDYPQELFRIDVGRIHGVKPGNIVGAIANEAGLQSKFISGLKIHDDHSTVRLPQNMPKEVFQDLNKAWVCGRQLKLTSLGTV
ncbi:ATP-dependent RNA helicase [Legionella taurinensis]|uniref:ATP-dependent RNA helicase DeaD n=1 Tax=Legionella taurinensis TaxID=70611 RepID=A0A3A5LJ91_9GAMM|nr:DEAD/DEAH box helicase [Legionella taurinensis]MDX1837475.1 DEAD/DEAH box helicase [Legionella taurinensis]PUT40819.1 ATP-dependent RNA helicase [Legionella taurinensis]PUT44240.1 ATP-dependent RNA helicase [Legionella taurinensis]PUT47542.1 ATP-dependent RNA helicase [Legionella taurinensis]PUT48681.1 ATP-dependent RNA helicase [Legionella taurinensis]